MANIFIACPSGTYSDPSSSLSVFDSGCVQCPAGTFAASAGSASCTECPAGEASDEGASGTHTKFNM